MIPINSLHQRPATDPEAGSSPRWYDHWPKANYISEQSYDSHNNIIRKYRSPRDIPITDLFDETERPVFIVDLKDLAYLRYTVMGVRFPVTYQNDAMRASRVPLYAVLGHQDSDQGPFRKWVLSTQNLGKESKYAFKGYLWKASTIKKRWKIVSGVRNGIKAPLDSRDLLAVSSPPSSSNLTNSMYFTTSKPSGDRNTSRRSRSDDTSASGPSDLATSMRSDSTTSKPSNSAQTNPPLPSPLGRGSKFVMGDVDIQDSMTDVFGKLPSPEVDLSLNSKAPVPYEEFVLSYDWASTPLGAIDNWSISLRGAVNHLICNPSPTVLYWGTHQGHQLGPELTMLYGESAAPLFGDKHPYVFGTDPRKTFVSGFSGMSTIFQECLKSRKGKRAESLLFTLDRGILPAEETYFSVVLVPVIAEDVIVGWFQQIFETTQVVLAQRRMSTLLKVSEDTATCSSMTTFWSQVTQALDQNHHDISFALLYSTIDDLEDHPPQNSSDVQQTKQFNLEGVLGLPLHHPAVLNQTQINISRGQAGFVPFFKGASGLSEPLYLRVSDGTLPEHLVAGTASRVSQEPCDAVLICAIQPTTGSSSTRNAALGFLVIGLNPHRPYDDDYRSFARLLERQITTSMASVLLLEEEVRRSLSIVEQAAIDQRRVEEEMATRTKELEKSELLYKRLVDTVPVGLFVMDYLSGDTNGSYAYRNEKWFEMSNDDRDNLASWRSPVWAKIHPDDQDTAREGWLRLMEGSGTRIEYRIRNRGADGDHCPENYVFVLMNASSYRHEDGSLKMVVASAADITSTKRAEEMQKQMAEDALESKRFMEKFIDVTSHEMRNPLGAIMISAEDIVKTVASWKAEIRGRSQLTHALMDLVEDVDEAAHTILHCAQHQKRIVDDILTISKIGSGLFAISPEMCQIVDEAKNIMKMFQGEFAAKDIKSRLIVEEDFEDLGISWVLLDPSRLAQIVINMLTNAIKFTAERPTRMINIRLTASLEEPETIRGVEFLPRKKGMEDLTLRPEWGEGKAIFLGFLVEDTGCGIGDTKILFNRFLQAPRTHVNYGGSGLGLFISKELTEMQGGRMGVSSVFGVGSTFACYIKSRMAASPPKHDLPTFEVYGPILPMPADTEIDINSTLTPSPMVHDGEKSPVIQNAASFPLDIMLVEDNKINQQVLLKQLRKAGHTVVIANHGLEAIDIVSTSTHWVGQESDGINITVALLDVEMPIMDGVTCIKRLREAEAEGLMVRHLPVIGITANARKEQIKEYRLAGMDDVISKPFSVSELLDRMERLVHGGRNLQA